MSALASSLALCGIALVVEALVGYPEALFRRLGHPVTWMGGLIDRLDRGWNREDAPAGRRRALGAVALFVVLAATGIVGGLVSVVAWNILPPAGALFLLGILASACLAQRSLDAHVGAVADALAQVGLDAGRKAVARIVGRDTSDLDEAGVARAAIESLAENFADGIVAPAVFIALFGLPGGLLYKAVNTADSMIGHRTTRHAAFGFAAAKVDDVANFLPARLAALCLVAAAPLAGGSLRKAWRITRRDAAGHPSPNAGWPEAAMAGALGLRLGGPRVYAGQRVVDAYIGDGQHRADAHAIRRALAVYRAACGLQLAAVVVAALVIARWR